MVRVKREDIEGYDLGYLHNQKADFNVLYITMKQYLNLSAADQSELDYGFARAEIVTKWPLVAFLGTTLFCLAMSTLLHLCWVRDEKTCQVLAYLDYWGIAILFLGSCYPYISLKFACGPFIVWRYLFISIISVLSLVCMWATVQKRFLTPMRRAFLFLLFSLSCVVPVVMLAFCYDPLYTLPP